MRLIVEVFSRAWWMELGTAPVKQLEETGEQEEFDHAPVDPHSVGGGLLEHAAPAAVEVQQFSGSGVYPRQSRKFGFSSGDEA